MTRVRCTWRWPLKSPVGRGFSFELKCCRWARVPIYSIWISLGLDNLNSLSLNSIIPWCRASGTPKIRTFSWEFSVYSTYRRPIECDFRNIRKSYNIRTEWVSNTSRTAWIHPMRKSTLESSHTICTGRKRRCSKWWTVFVHWIYLNRSLKY